MFFGVCFWGVFWGRRVGGVFVCLFVCFLELYFFLFFFKHTFSVADVCLLIIRFAALSPAVILLFCSRLVVLFTHENLKKIIIKSLVRSIFIRNVYRTEDGVAVNRQNDKEIWS